MGRGENDPGGARLFALPGRLPRIGGAAVVRMAVEHGLVAVRLRDPRVEIVRHQDRRDRAIELQGVHVGGDPVGQRLGGHGLGIRVVAGTQHRHEELGRADLAGLRVDDGERVAGEVEEALLARPVLLPHDEIEPALPAPVVANELRVLVAVGVGGLELQPEQLQRDALAPQLAVDGRPVGHRARRARWQRGRREEARLQGRLVQVLGQGPAKAGPPGAVQIVGHRGVRHPQRGADPPPAQALGKGKAEDLAHLAHGGAGARHRHLLLERLFCSFEKDAVPGLPQP